MPARADSSSEKKPPDSEQALQECTALEIDLAELKANYEQFFLGVDRIPPVKKHEAIKRRMATLKGAFIRQTVVKFRIQSVAAKLVTYERLWERTLKEIEAGTYRRDVFKARLHRKEREAPKENVAAAQSEDLDLSDLDVDEADDLETAFAKVTASTPTPAPKVDQLPSLPPIAAKPPASSPPSIAPVKAGVPAIKPVTGSISLPTPKPTTGPISVPTPKPATGSVAVPAVKPVTPGVPPIAPAQPTSRPVVTAPLPSSPPAKPMVSPPTPRPQAQASAPPTSPLSDQKIKAIYEAYVMAKKRCGEDTRSLTLDSVASTLKKQVPELMRQHNARSVEFKVVIKDGKAVLRAMPKDT